MNLIDMHGESTGSIQSSRTMRTYIPPRVNMQFSKNKL